ncbi:MAG: Hdr-like menaquinol oxidoreductase cytochrome c subunit [Gammaproteobacteria bacterium]|nr:Hdr-like menaquinol oxidoreductase cytochrome c subunit [Gammaproteobacteria bacterium]
MTKQNALLSLILLILSGQLIAAEYYGPDRDESGDIVPQPLGDACIAPLDEMRRTHMRMLMHKRDKTVHQGIRSKKASLTECINCHATPGANGKIARIDNDEHFCVSCHVAASVTIDCFECHADRPVAAFKQAGSQ